MAIEGELSENPFWFQLWNKSEIEEMNRNYKVQEYLIDYVGFGTNGGGELLVFDKMGKIFTIPFIPMVPEEAMVVAESWDDFLKLIVKDHD